MLLSLYALTTWPIFSLLHKKADMQSSALATLACGHKVEVIKEEGDYVYAKVNKYQGYILKRLLQEKSNCWQDQYPRFFYAFNLDLTDSYYFAKLYDVYAVGSSY